MASMGDEQQLVQAAKRGHLEAFNALVTQYQDAVYSTAYRIMGDPASAADIAQETFITAYRRLETYRGGNMKAWLLRIGTNLCLDELRRQKRRPATSLDELPGSENDDGPPLADSLPTPEQVAQQHELAAAIQSCIDTLQAEQRVTLVLSDVEGFSYQEIADQTGTQLGTVKSRLSRARLAMRQCLEAIQELLPAEYRLMRSQE